MASTTRTRSTRRNPFHPRPRSWPESGTWDTGAWIAKVASVWASAVGNPRHIRVHGLARTRGLPYRPRCDIHDSRSPHRRTDGFSTLWRRGSTAKACTSYSPATSITRSEIPPSSSSPSPAGGVGPGGGVSSESRIKAFLQTLSASRSRPCAASSTAFSSKAGGEPPVGSSGRRPANRGSPKTVGLLVSH
jgi:hypothetical protein